ncbi:MAG: hypothetical protein EPN82_03295 [Bacteroidetes bacterium]|nr:MAG: hypothetical protein EPN82_03295 [Bacteroidota bacterium]
MYLNYKEKKTDGTFGAEISYKIVYNETFILPSNSNLDLQIKIDGINLNFQIQLEDTGVDKPYVNWTTKDIINNDSTFYIHLTGWRNSIGAVMPVPAKVGNINGKSIYFYFCSHFIANSNLITFQIMQGI